MRFITECNVRNDRFPHFIKIEINLRWISILNYHPFVKAPLCMCAINSRLFPLPLLTEFLSDLEVQLINHMVSPNDEARVLCAVPTRFVQTKVSQQHFR